MAINLYNIKKWYKMITGKSILHVNQNLGEQFTKNELNGYFNNMTQKVSMVPDILENEKLPTVLTEQGEVIYFPVAIFQYGLGCYDLYLKENDKKYLAKFLQCVNWAFEHQEKNGAWNNFFFIYPNSPYGAMCQGEGISLLVRGYKETGNLMFLEAAKKALDFLILPIEKGGTAKYTPSGVELLEYTHRPVVLNGWIFALFGIYDFLLVEENNKYREIFKSTLECLKRSMNKFDNGYWSIYDLEGRIASAFYHNLHIAQMKALYIISGEEIFNRYKTLWQKEQHTTKNRYKAFIVKAYQKIREK